MPFVSEDPDTSVARLGGKGANLAQLARADFRVPPGFVVTTAAYEAFLAHNALQELIDSAIAGLDYRDPEKLELATEGLRQAIVEAELPEEVAAFIRKSYDELGADAFVAVRSSGTAEDTTDASFAGLHDTYLDVRGADQVIHAVRQCWASMWTARATTYRHTTGYDHGQARIAVVVQAMISSEVSGVMFTANPLNARTDEIVLNASWGLGEGIVSGILTPDEYVLSRDTVVVKRRTLGSKAVQVRRDTEAGSGTVTIDTPPALRDVFALTDETASRLGALGRDIMRHYGGLPQDIEWAYAGGDLYVLQSRPVTGIELTWDEDLDAWQPNPEKDDDIWTSKWAEDFWTGAITPLFYSVRSKEFWDFIVKCNSLWGFEELNRERFFKYRRGTAFYNCRVDIDFYRWSQPRALRPGSLNYMPDSWKAEAAAHPLDLRRFLGMHARLNLLDPKKRVNTWIQTVQGYIDNEVEQANGPDPDELRLWTDDAVRRQAQEMIDLAGTFMEQLWNGIFTHAMTAMGVLGLMLAKWYDGDNAFIFQDLISGLPTQTLMAKEEEDFWQLGELVRRSPALTELIESSPGGAFFEAVRQHPEGAEFAKAYDRFLADHGHRGHADRDIYFSRRIEDPALDYQPLFTLVKAGETIRPSEREATVAKRREEHTADVVRRIEQQPLGFLKVAAFKTVHQYVLRFLVLRDDWRHWIDRVTLSKKRAFLELSRRAVERGVLESVDDCYFLSQTEFYEAFAGQAQMPLVRAKVKARREVFLRFLDRDEVPPRYLKGSVATEIDAPAVHADGALQGAGTSQGIATGRARIVGDLKYLGRVEKGDILVCNATDPGWAVVFSVINGLVLEAGGMLAHGSCLAREHGLPAVQISNAMRLIPDGAIITVNGNTGQVTVDQPAAAAGEASG